MKILYNQKLYNKNIIQQKNNKLKKLYNKKIKL